MRNSGFSMNRSSVVNFKAKALSPLLVASARRCYTSRAARATSRPTEVEVHSSRAYCLNLLRKYDSPSFTLQTFIPSYARDAYLAIRAFNIETARVADVTSTATIGLMRMQFWRNTIEKSLDGAPPKEPVAILLATAAENLHNRTDGKSRISKAWFNKIINAREQRLSNPPYPDLQAVENYAENTYSTLLYLTLSSLPIASITTDHIASHIGKAMGIVAVLRGIPLIAFPMQPSHGTSNGALGNSMSGNSQGSVLFPLDIMAETGLKEEEVLRQGASAPGLCDTVFAIATRANDHLITAREMLKNIQSGKDAGHDFEHQHDDDHQYSAQQLHTGPQHQIEEVDAAFGVFMAAIPTQVWLDRLQAIDFDVFHPTLRTTDWRLPWKSYWAFNRRKL